MGDLVADAILDNTKPLGAQIGLMNVGGVRASLNMISYGEAEGQITYAEAFDIAPFGNVYLALNLTGAQLKEVLEQQYQPGPARGPGRCSPWGLRRLQLHLGRHAAAGIACRARLDDAERHPDR